MALDFIKRGILFVIADILSIVTVLLCLVQKLPQIRDVYAYKSAKGKCYHLDAIEIILLDCADSSIGNLIAFIHGVSFNCLCFYLVQVSAPYHCIWN